ncbi:MAG TPA: hypothetical protein PKD54_06535 [Pirellulaceae bacterium]|nr:hypothetical protein [Pirellulaceae bacterium]
MSNRVLVAIGLCCVNLAAWCGSPGVTSGQSDTVYLINGAPVRGTVASTTMLSIKVRTSDGEQDVPVQNIRSITLADAPPEMTRATQRFGDNRFDDGLAELEKITNPPRGGFVSHQLDYLRAFGMSQSALTGGNVPLREAGSAVNAFLKKYPESHQLIPMAETLGRLLVLVGEHDLARSEFSKLVQCGWPEYELKGNYQLGELNLLLNHGEEAEKNFASVMGSDVNTPAAVALKSVSRCLRAKAMIMAGRGDEGRRAVEEIIQRESPDNQALFAHAYNALGLYHMQRNDAQSAVLAFLHTDLLFPSQADAHAEALYFLSQLYPKLGKNDDAYSARESLRSQYRNSTWVNKLD